MSDLSAIAAISTPLGTGGVGIIRISGKNATEIADRDICILAEKVTAQGVLLGNLRKRQMSPFDKRPSSVSAAHKALRG